MNEFEKYTDRDGYKLIVIPSAQYKLDSLFVGCQNASDNEIGIDLSAQDAPAVALAILEAAGIEGGGISDPRLSTAWNALNEHEKIRAELAEREAEDARVVAFWDALNPGYTIAEAAENIGVSDRVREQYRAAREFFKENP